MNAQLPHPLDICACGHVRSEHDNDGPCVHGDYHQPSPCVQFRLVSTSSDILEAMERWDRILKGEGK